MTPEQLDIGKVTTLKEAIELIKLQAISIAHLQAEVIELAGR
jgi:hypothetical protein